MIEENKLFPIRNCFQLHIKEDPNNIGLNRFRGLFFSYIM